MPAYDWRLEPSHFDTPAEPAGTERSKYLQAALPAERPAATTHTPVPASVATSTTRFPRNRCTTECCATEHCGLIQCVAAVQAKLPLCEECYDMELTRESNLQLTAPAVPAKHIPRVVSEDNTYAMAWTDGGCKKG